jgi:hypothetical protein
VAKVEYDDPQIWSVKDFLQSERDGIRDLVEEMGQEEHPDVAKIQELVTVVGYLEDRIAGKYLDTQ